jgi:hypothetical protein
MALVPRATVTVEPTSAAPSSGVDLVCVLAPVATSPDMVPRLFGSAQAVYEQHGYSEGVEYVAKHASQTGKSCLFVGMPIGTAGAISRSTSFSNTGSSVPTVAAGGDGVLAEHDGVVRVIAGGTIGTDQIKLELSLDGGRSFSPVRLGTAVSYALPYVNATLSFAAGTLVAGDTILEWHGSAPRIDTGDLDTVRAALAAGNKLFRSVLITGDMTVKASADAVVTELNAYATSNERFAFARCSVGPDRVPQALMSKVVWRMTGNPTLTFAEVGGTGDTVTRSTGSWIADGAVVGDTVTFAGTASNNVTGVIASLSATVITFGTTDLAAEVIAVDAGPVIAVGTPTLTFAEVGATGDTVTRNRGSWLVDGFRVADTVSFTGTASNNVSGAVTAVTALVLTYNTTDLAAEVVGTLNVTCSSSQTKAAWMAALDAVFAGVDGQPRIDLSAGRGAEFSTFSGWNRRIPAAWFASAREYAHDLHVATWRKDLGPVGADLFDTNNQLIEWDDRVDGGAGSAANFTTLRTWANGPRGGFITQSLTRAGDGQIASKTHNAAVINEACNVVQQATENVIGRSLILNADGTATKDSLAVIAAEVNAALQLSLLQSRGEGPRASSCVWTPDPADIYSVSEPVMHGTLALDLNGTIHSVDTSVRVNTSGQ